jgi:hypothetical protein
MAKKFENYQLDELLAVPGKKKKLLYQNFGVMDLAVFGSKDVKEIEGQLAKKK